MTDDHASDTINKLMDDGKLPDRLGAEADGMRQVLDHINAPTIAAGPLANVIDLLKQGITPDQLNTLLDVQHKWEAEQARRAYVRAMAAFKAEPITAIVKRKRVGFKLKNRQGELTDKELTYKHETLGQVVKAVVADMAKHGLAHHWDVRQEPNGKIGVRCVLAHEEGHVEQGLELFGQPDDSGQKNPLQQLRSTITFLQRATLLLITGLAAEDGSDDDSRGAYPESRTEARSEPVASGKATAAQLKLIRKKLEANGRDEAAFCTALGIASLDVIEFNRVNEALEAAAKS